VLAWDSTLELLWKALTEPSPAVDSELRSHLARYHQGPHSFKREDLVDESGEYSDNDTAAAAIITLEGYCDPHSGVAASVVSRLLDAYVQSSKRLDKGSEPGPVTGSYEEDWALTMERELDLLEPAVGIIEKAGVTPSSIKQM
jgi:hypothetical protein